MWFPLLIALLAASAPLRAAPSLRAALDAALARSPEALVLEARATDIAARRLATDSWSPAPPAAIFANRRDNTLIDQQLGKQEFEAEIEIPVWLPGQRGAQRAKVDADARVVDAARGALRAELAGRLREAIAAVREARALANAARRRVETATALEAAVARRLRAGDVARGDLAMAQSESLAAQEVLLAAQFEEKRALADFDVLTGLREAPDTDEEEAGPTIDWKLGPGLVFLSARVAASRAQVGLVRSTSRDSPTVALQNRADRDFYGSDVRNTYRLTVRIPFGTEARNAPRISAAEIEYTQALSDERAAILRGDAAVETARAGVASARQRERLAARQADASADALRLAQRAFEAGELPVALLLAVRARAIEADLNAERARAGRAAAIARLNQTLGVMP